MNCHLFYKNKNIHYKKTISKGFCIVVLESSTGFTMKFGSVPFKKKYVDT